MLLLPPLPGRSSHVIYGYIRVRSSCSSSVVLSARLLIPFDDRDPTVRIGRTRSFQQDQIAQTRTTTKERRYDMTRTPDPRRVEDKRIILGNAHDRGSETAFAAARSPTNEERTRRRDAAGENMPTAAPRTYMVLRESESLALAA